MEPIYLISTTPEEYAQDFKTRLLALGCSESYSEKARKNIVGRAVVVGSAYEANAIQSGRQP